MARYTAVYSDFLDRTREVVLLQKEAAKLERSTTSTQHGDRINAYCRGAIVLLSSHIEAYIKELGEHALDRIYEREVCRSKIPDPLFYFASQERVDHIGSSIDPVKTARHIFSFIEYEASNWKRNGGFERPILASTFNSGFSNPRLKKVKGYFTRFGYTNYERDLRTNLTTRSNSILSGIDHIIDTRNLIAHGDISANKTPNEVAVMVSNSTYFCRATDQVFSHWCKTQFCSIR